MTADTTPSENDEILRVWRDALLDRLAETDGPLADVRVDIDAVLGLAGAVAHGVVRPAAPLTAYLVGLAVGRATAAGEPETEAFARATASARALAASGRFSPPRSS